MQSEKKKKVVLGVIIALALFVIGAGVYCGMMLKNDKKPVTWLAVGDSLTWGEGYYRKCYLDYIEREHSEVTADKKGVPGMYTAQLVSYAGNGFLDVDYNPDIVTVLMGTNDFGLDNPLDQYEIDLENLIKVVKEKYPNSRIIFLTPPYRDYYGERKYILSGMVNHLGNSLYDYINVIKEKAKENGIEVVELTEDECLNKDNLKDSTLDGLHPNDKGNKLLADKVYKEVVTNNK